MEFINTIQTIFDNFSNNNNIFFGGDFNINLFNHRNNALIKYFIDYIYSLNCRPLINKATRIANDDHSNSESLIDNIYCNLNIEPINKGIIYSDISDHFPIFTSINFKVAKPKIYRQSHIGIMNDETISALKKYILIYNWTYINDSSLNLNEVVYKFINSLNILYNKNCPLSIKKKIHKNHKINPWMTDSLLKCVSKKKNYISNL